jgi:riboflavin synthase
VFTGIIEQTVPVRGVSNANGIRRLKLAVPWNDLRLGESIAVNGCCLTVARQTGGEIEFDVVAQTLSLTNLGRLKSGDEVHLERSLQANGRIDGHFVQGHIDGVAELLARSDHKEETRLTLRTPPALAKYIVPQGSVALDGVSLTIAGVKDDQFEVALIPTTLARTALGRRPIGWLMNLEADILAKTIVFWLERGQKLGQSTGERRGPRTED